ncbi:LysR family transcriptional regulator [Acidisoma sp. 7E03]
MPRNLDIALLRTFVLVADQRSMTRASALLHLTQGAISQQIARLEGMVGHPLLQRNPQGLRLTPGGERLLSRARALLALNDEIWTEIDGGVVAGSVRLGLPYDLLEPYFAPMLRLYGASFPKVDLSLTCAPSPDLRAMVRSGQLDLAVVEEPAGMAQGEMLAVDRLVWVGAKAGQARLRQPLPISLVAESCVFRPAVLSALAQADRASRLVFENGGLDATRTVVRMDMAISAWLAGTVPADLDILGPETDLPPLPQFAVTLHLADGARGPAIAELARQLRGAMARPRLAAS